MASLDILAARRLPRYCKPTVSFTLPKFLWKRRKVLASLSLDKLKILLSPVILPTLFRIFPHIQNMAPYHSLCQGPYVCCREYLCLPTEQRPVEANLQKVPPFLLPLGRGTLRPPGFLRKNSNHHF